MPSLAHDYRTIVRQAPVKDAPSIIRHLDQILPTLWQADYEADTGIAPNLVTVSFGGEILGEPFCRYLFEHASVRAGEAPIDDRVIAVWGVSRRDAAATRDRPRMKGFLQGIWSSVYRGADRGHFFAHSMGGGLDINLFPQSKIINRSGSWRRMESYCARNPGTFCFVRPIYRDRSWIPSQLEFGIFKTTESDPTEFWGHVFENDPTQS